MQRAKVVRTFSQMIVGLASLISSWSFYTGHGDHLPSEEAFLFSMVNPPGLAPGKLVLNREKQQHAIYCNNNAGPSFGTGCDLYISDLANTSGSSYSNLGYTYQLPKGYESTSFTGAGKFIVTDYEVFGVN